MKYKVEEALSDLIIIPFDESYRVDLNSVITLIEDRKNKAMQEKKEAQNQADIERLRKSHPHLFK